MAARATADLCAAVRAELTRIIASEKFDASDRNRRFLEYIVEETLEDRSDRIKAYSPPPSSGVAATSTRSSIPL